MNRKKVKVMEKTEISDKRVLLARVVLIWRPWLWKGSYLKIGNVV